MGGAASYLPNSFSTSGCWPGYAYNLFSKIPQSCLIDSDAPEVNITLIVYGLPEFIIGANRFAR